MEKKSTIFRKASLDRVSSPEQLNDIIKVSNPSVWLILIAVAVLLAGVSVWGVLGTITTTTDAVAVVTDGEATCYVAAEKASNLAAGMEVGVGESKGTIVSLAAAPVEVTAEFDAYAIYLGGLKVGDWVLPVTVELAAPDGVHMAEIVTETISPISLVLN